MLPRLSSGEDEQPEKRSSSSALTALSGSSPEIHASPARVCETYHERVRCYADRHKRAPRPGPGAGLLSGLRPAFLMTFATAMPTIQQDIEAALAEAEPAVEVLLAEVVSGDTVRLYIDHPDGVSLALCERVTDQLPEVRERYALEVSSPGPDRPLAKPGHFQRFVGRRACVRLRTPREGHKQYTGELVGATDEAVTLATPDGIVSVAYDDIARSNLVPGE